MQSIKDFFLTLIHDLFKSTCFKTFVNDNCRPSIWVGEGLNWSWVRPLPTKLEEVSMTDTTRDEKHVQKVLRGDLGINPIFSPDISLKKPFIHPSR